MRYFPSFFVIVLILSQAWTSAQAQTETRESPSMTEQNSEHLQHGANAGDMAIRLDLSEKMHKIRPARKQIDSAIEQVARNGLSVEEQQAFILSMKRIIDYKALEKASIEAMAETFSAPELKAMVDYYEKPEAQSANEKFPDYQKKIEPIIYQMLDRAMMQVRTGSAPGSIK